MYKYNFILLYKNCAYALAIASISLQLTLASTPTAASSHLSWETCPQPLKGRHKNKNSKELDLLKVKLLFISMQECVLVRVDVHLWNKNLLGIFKLIFCQQWLHTAKIPVQWEYELKSLADLCYYKRSHTNIHFSMYMFTAHINAVYIPQYATVYQLGRIGDDEESLVQVFQQLAS